MMRYSTSIRLGTLYSHQNFGLCNRATIFMVGFLKTKGKLYFTVFPFAYTYYTFNELYQIYSKY